MRTPTLLSLIVLVAAVLACADSQGPDGGPREGGGGPIVPLQDVVVSSLPSPYYHFEYDGEGRIERVSFASDFLIYDVAYQGNRIAELRNNTAGNMDRLQYVYDAAGQVQTVNYVDPAGVVFARVRLTYDGGMLSQLDRERKLAAGFTVEKTLSFSYYGDGNLQQIVDHRPAITGRQDETTTVDRFEQYDAGVNVEAFSLIHNDFFDHVVLLPDVQLQHGNPAREFLSGGSVDYRFDYTYTYDDHDRPLLKSGTATILTGPDAGRTIPLQTVFSYY